MIPMNLGNDFGPLKSVLAIGAHCDDIEIGCGGTLMQLVKRYPDLSVTWVVFTSDAVREREARKSAGLFLEGAGSSSVIVKQFRNGYFPYQGALIKDFFEELKTLYDPDLIFTHFRDDLHQDHQTLSKLTWNTFRKNLILEYEIPKFDGDLGCPNLFVPLTEEICKLKCRYIDECFQSQRDKHWFSEDLFKALMRLRAMEANCSPKRYTEAFYCRKLIWNLSI